MHLEHCPSCFLCLLCIHSFADILFIGFQSKWQLFSSVTSDNLRGWRISNCCSWFICWGWFSWSIGSSGLCVYILQCNIILISTTGTHRNMPSTMKKGQLEHSAASERVGIHCRWGWEMKTYYRPMGEMNGCYYIICVVLLSNAMNTLF